MRPSRICPLRNGEQTAPDEHDVAGGSSESDVAEEELFGLMVAGGKHKAPLARFKDLVRRVHKGQRVTDVYVTDPYLLHEIGEEGQSGGLEVFVEYLAALGIVPRGHGATVYVAQPKGGSSERKERFSKALKGRLPAVRVEFIVGSKFHDRFYIAASGGEVRGVFGPSINGLSSKSIVLMGELEKEALKYIREALDM